jgi:hypothetical protein
MTTLEQRGLIKGLAKYRVHGALVYTFEVEATDEEDAVDKFFDLECQERKQYCVCAEMEAIEVFTS